VVADFGHGVFNQSFIEPIAATPCFLALTVQSNSLNWGFNLYTKWPRADYIVLDEQELRLAYQDKLSVLGQLLHRTREQMGAGMAVVTQGHKGCLVAGRTQDYRIPALTERTIDRLGAGDCFFALTSSLAYLECPPEVLGFIGNSAAALHVNTVGNTAIDKEKLVRFMEGLLK